MLRTKRLVFREDGSPGFWQALPHLIGHIVGAAIIFSLLALIAWLLGVAVGWLNAIVPFNPHVLATLHNVETALLYLDIGLSSIVVVVGGYRFLREIV